METSNEDSWLLRSYDEHAAAPPDTTLIIAFAGLAGRLGGRGGSRDGDVYKENTEHAGTPPHEFIKACRHAGVTHAIFCRDLQQSWYLKGTPEKQGGFDTVVAALRAEIEAVKPVRVVTLGASMGGYAAIRAALTLEADAVIAFSPQVILDSTDRTNAALPVMPFDTLLCQLKRVMWLQGIPMTSLLDVVSTAQSRPTTKTCIEVHVGGDEEGDCREADMLRQQIETASGGLSIDVRVWPGHNHNVVTALRDQGILHEMLKQHCAQASSDNAA
eukprot:gnl/MRDRNA2_/MRDRNA2_118970_c0_seq1.p1 gnl/MRDRNA2_/MRDRNA2_118970_c0~~gnl/MRDRNA2_/MRDRNA2_118970_c0_seq1.p1  ORF type:complete len:273 (-),score=58.34 gnl/MRDRNA2_/MRDRNA2_118970_c0_seq1:222-1040(-)